MSEGLTSDVRRVRGCAILMPAILLLGIGLGALRTLIPLIGTLSVSELLLFSAALAGDKDGGDRGDNGWGQRYQNGNNNNNDGQDRGDNVSRGEGPNCCRTDDSGAGPSSVTGNLGALANPSGGMIYDANRNMLEFRWKLNTNEGGDRPSVPVHFGHPDANSREMLYGLPHGGAWIYDGKAQEPFHHFALGDWHEQQAANALKETLAPLERRLHTFVIPSHPQKTTVIPKTKPAIGSLTFSSIEILGVDMDDASRRRAEELGFGVEAKSGEWADITRLTVPPGLDAIRAKELLELELPGKRFELNRLYRVYRTAVSDDPEQSRLVEMFPHGGGQPCLADRCAARNIIRWNDGLSSCAVGLPIGIIDTGIDARHPAFAGSHIQRADFIPQGKRPAPTWHGTAVLSQLAATPSGAAPGLIPHAEFYAASAFFAEQNGEIATDTSSVVSALRWLDGRKVKLVNMSFSGPRDSLVEEEIQKMSSKGIVFIAAAGNEGPTAEPSYPAAYQAVIAVTAVTNDLRNYRYANRGGHIDVAAPGVDIWAAVPDERAGYHTGTSFAAPFVTAVMAITSRDRLGAPKEALLDHFDYIDLGAPGRDPIYGRGLLLAPPRCSAETIASAAPQN